MNVSLKKEWIMILLQQSESFRGFVANHLSSVNEYENFVNEVRTKKTTEGLVSAVKFAREEARKSEINSVLDRKGYEMSGDTLTLASAKKFAESV